MNALGTQFRDMIKLGTGKIAADGIDRGKFIFSSADIFHSADKKNYQLVSNLLSLIKTNRHALILPIEDIGSLPILLLLIHTFSVLSLQLKKLW